MDSNNWREIYLWNRTAISAENLTFQSLKKKFYLMFHIYVISSRLKCVAGASHKEGRTLHVKMYNLFTNIFFCCSWKTSYDVSLLKISLRYHIHRIMVHTLNELNLHISITLTIQYPTRRDKYQFNDILHWQLSYHLSRMHRILTST